MKIFALNYVSDDGVNRFILIPEKVVFIAENHRNPLTTFSLEPKVV